MPPVPRIGARWPNCQSGVRLETIAVYMLGSPDKATSHQGVLDEGVGFIQKLLHLMLWQER